MTRSFASIPVGVALTIAAAGAAHAQAIPTAPPPGSGDSGAIVSANREANSAYNSLIGAADANHPISKPAPAATAAVPATPADLVVGSRIRDRKGVPIGSVAQVMPDGVVVDTGTTHIMVPALAFGKDSQGLLLNLTAERFNELVAKAQAAR